MQRNVKALADRPFDLLIVGGGIHGAWAAWDATLRGLAVALVERADFGAATSANSLRIIHGGLRYLQTLNLRRMRESIGERSILMRLAPRLVRPLPVLVATQGTGKHGRLALGAALALNDAISFDRNRGLDGVSRIPRGRLLSRRDCLAAFPPFESVPLSGGALWYDGQVLDSERLTLSLVLSAAGRGGALVNHVEARSLLVRDGRVEGVTVEDRPTGARFDVRARIVLEVTGETGSLANARGDRPTAPRSRRALAVNVVVRRRLAELAVGLRVRTPSARDPVCGGGRHVFLAPWREGTIVGTIYRPWVPQPESPPEAIEDDLRGLVDECNEVCPSLALSLDELTAYHRGLVPLKGGSEPGRPEALAEATRVLDHERVDALAGLVSLSGVKYTTARAAAERAIDLVCAKLGRAVRACSTREEALPAEPLSSENALLRGQVLHAVRAEMALTLGDIARRLGFGGGPCPPRAVLASAAGVAADELGWSAARTANEIEDVIRAHRLPGADGERS